MTHTPTVSMIKRPLYSLTLLMGVGLAGGTPRAGADALAEGRRWIIPSRRALRYDPRRAPRFPIRILRWGCRFFELEVLQGGPLRCDRVWLSECRSVGVSKNN